MVIFDYMVSTLTIVLLILILICKFLKFRYKISAALSEAGLATTSYAKQLMKGVEGNLKPRRDMMGQL